MLSLISVSGKLSSVSRFSQQLHMCGNPSKMGLTFNYEFSKLDSSDLLQIGKYKWNGFSNNLMAEKVHTTSGLLHERK